MRILEGKHAGRWLTSPGGDVRPTPESVRARALAMVGLEALSRGAISADFVENGPAALHALKANVAALRETKRCRIFKKDAIPWVEALERGAYAVAFADPPYGSAKLDRIVARWREVPFADVLVFEHAKDHVLDVRGLKAKHYDFEGPTRVTILRA
jgi:16S rRNA (guanine966-N2)-methyltransferase